MCSPCLSLADLHVVACCSRPTTSYCVSSLAAGSLGLGRGRGRGLGAWEPLAPMACMACMACCPSSPPPLLYNIVGSRSAPQHTAVTCLPPKLWSCTRRPPLPLAPSDTRPWRARTVQASLLSDTSRSRMHPPLAVAPATKPSIRPWRAVLAARPAAPAPAAPSPTKPDPSCWDSQQPSAIRHGQPDDSLPVPGAGSGQAPTFPSPPPGPPAAPDASASRRARGSMSMSLARATHAAPLLLHAHRNHAIRDLA